MNNTGNRFLKWYAICISILCCAAILAFLLIFWKAGYGERILVRMGFKEPSVEANWAVGGWNNTLMKLDYDADVVFFGDSITWSSDFRNSFPECRIVNLGYYGDTLAGMLDRVAGAAAVNPEKVFLLGGINGLTDQNADVSFQTYIRLVEEMKAAMPEAEIYIQSVLPISAQREAYGCHNTTIRQFNQNLEALAQSMGMTYVDLYTLYEKDGHMDPQYSSDGLHLKPEAYELWADAIKEYMDGIYLQQR